MADLALAGLQWAASPIVNKLLDHASTYLGVDMVSELHDLETTVMPQFNLVIEAAEQSRYKGEMEAWLRRLKEAYYDAEDLLDEHEYNRLKRKVKSGKEDGTSIRSTIMMPFCAAGCKASNLLPENRRMIRKMNKLKAILAEAKGFRELLGLPAGSIAAIPETSAAVATTTSHPTSKVFGRDKDRDRIIDFLLNKTITSQESSTSYSSLAIVGAGGMGKSTLAQYVYNDSRIEDHFDVRMWVCISRKLDVHRHTCMIIESANEGKCPRLENLDTLQCKLKDILQSKKFLLVLDDVWFQESDSEIEWQQLLAPLVEQTAGSKVLVTTRRDTLPAALCCRQVVRLENVDDAEFLALFKHHAFSGAEIEDQTLRMKLEEAAEKIVKRLGKSPLAAKVLGSQLSKKKNVAAWRDALRIDNLNEPMNALLWSYKKLDPRLQRCFLYCSLFPKGHKFKKDELVHLWVSEGYIYSRNSSKTMEDVGEDYLNEMVSVSFFQMVPERYVGCWYIMHDLLHDLAESLSKEDCFRVDDDMVPKIPCTVRHLSIRVESMIRHKQIISELHNLRTVICIDPLMDEVEDVFHQVLQNMKKLRVLYLSCYNSSKLPKSVGEFKHLRYLNLVKTFIYELPRSLGTLYHLQLLQLNYKVKGLPNEICNLSNLRYLEGYDAMEDKIYRGVLPQVPNIGKLTSLQKLNEFSVQKKKGHELEQLRNMNELGGTLKIKNLENVSGKEEALESNLQQKIRLKDVNFVWCSQNDLDTEDNLHLEILEGLMPPPQLEGLVIEGYRSAVYPNWLLNGSYLENLEYFRLVNCRVVEGLPPDTNLFRHCHSLGIIDASNLKTLLCLPVGLKELLICGCPLLMFVTNDEQEQYDLRENIMLKDNLTSQLAFIWEADSELYIRVLSREHSSLKQLMTLMDDDIAKDLQTIRNALEEKIDDILVKEDIIKAWLCCHHQRIKLICGRSMGQGLNPPSGLCELHLSSCIITDRALAICLSSLHSLKELKLIEIMTLTSLPSEEVFQHLTKLHDLYISHCWYLRSLGGLRAATYLTKVIIRHCPSLELARGSRFMPLSLEDLIIHGCVLAPDIFCSDLLNLNSISLMSCRSSESLLVGHLPSLKIFSLHHLPDLRMLEELSSQQLQNVHLIDVPKLTAECILQFRVKETLSVSSSEFLNHMLSAEGFTVPPTLALASCKEPTVSFQESANFSSVKQLILWRCEMKSLPTNMMVFTGLMYLGINSCPNILSLPDLPSSLQRIGIFNCEALKESCRAPDGESWTKIAHIRWKDIS